MSDIEALIKQVMSSIASTAMSVTHDNFCWFFDSPCCNHMTTDYKSLPFATIVSSLPPIHTVNGNTMNITHTSHVSTSNITFPDTYYIPSSISIIIIDFSVIDSDGFRTLIPSTSYTN